MNSLTKNTKMMHVEILKTTFKTFVLRPPARPISGAASYRTIFVQVLLDHAIPGFTMKVELIYHISFYEKIKIPKHANINSSASRSSGRNDETSLLFELLLFCGCRTDTLCNTCIDTTARIIVRIPSFL